MLFYREGSSLGGSNFKDLCRYLSSLGLYLGLVNLSWIGIRNFSFYYFILLYVTDTNNYSSLNFNLNRKFDLKLKSGSNFEQIRTI